MTNGYQWLLRQSLNAKGLVVLAWILVLGLGIGLSVAFRGEEPVAARRLDAEDAGPRHLREADGDQRHHRRVGVEADVARKGRRRAGEQARDEDAEVFDAAAQRNELEGERREARRLRKQGASA